VLFEFVKHLEGIFRDFETYVDNVFFFEYMCVYVYIYLYICIFIQIHKDGRSAARGHTTTLITTSLMS